MILRISKLLVMSIVAIASLTAVAGEGTADAAKPKIENDPAFHPKLLELAANYESFGRINRDSHWAPFNCRLAGSPPPPSNALISNSEDENTHGKKLYFLFAKDRDYCLLNDPPPLPKGEDLKKIADGIEKSIKLSRAIGERFDKEDERDQWSMFLPLYKYTNDGQAVIKEAWSPKPADPDEKPQLIKHNLISSKYAPICDDYVPYVRKDGKLYKTGEKLGLFIIYKTDPKTPNTDDGWVYGTVSADGKKVLSAGRVQSCMDCHKDAPHERLFGLKNEK